MRAFIAERLAEIKNVEDRALLRQVLSDVFLPLYDETERKYAGLEQRVRDELPLLYDTYSICGTVLPRERVDGKHAYLSAMIPAETEDPVLSVRALSSDIQEGLQPVIETVFCEADYLVCQRVIRDDQRLNGAFVLKSERYAFKCCLKPADRYRELTESLYNTFQRNDVPWTTINSAYSGKFFDVCLIEFVQTPPPEMKIHQSQIEIDFGSYDEIVKHGLIPVWNIDLFRNKSEDFPMPVVDSVNYEYRFDTELLGPDCGFLVDYNNAYILHARREGTSLVVVSNKEKELVWDMYRFRRRQDTSMDVYPYPILSNERKDSFSTRLMNKYGAHIATKAEMRKLLNAFGASEYIELAGFHFAGEKLTGDTYDMNPFIRDEMRDPAFQKTLALSFKAKNKAYFLNRDIVSFLVSEFQAAYPEYRCVGILY